MCILSISPGNHEETMAVQSARSRTLGLLPALLLLAALTGAAADRGQDILERAQDLRVTDPESAIALLDQHIAETKIGMPEILGDDIEHLRAGARLLELRARIRRDIGQREAAAQDAVLLERIAQALGQPIPVARAQFMHGTIQAERGDIAAALERFHDARRTLEGTNATIELARVINAIGVAHTFSHDFSRAREYYQQALSTIRRADDNALETAILGNLALAIAELEGPEAGLAAHRKALTLARERGDTDAIGNQLANICSRLVETDRLNEAATICREALDRVEELGNARLIAGTRMSLGDLKLGRGQLEEARQSYEAALALAAARVPTVEVNVLEKLAALDERLDEPQQALDRLKQLMALRAERLEGERASLIEELEVRYRVEQQEHEIEVLELDRELQGSKLRQRNLLLIGTGIALLLVTLLMLVAWRGYIVKSRLERELAKRNQELGEALATITRLAREDPLTGMLNRRAFLELAEHEIRRSRRTREPLSLVMGDIDNFKSLNDRHGHAAGDEVLRQIARRMEQSTRELDIVCRWGGEEFLFLLPGTHKEEACRIIQRVRDRIAEERVEVNSQSIFITMTFGVATVDMDIGAAIERVDQAMYRGKDGGRNQIIVEENPSAGQVET